MFERFERWLGFPTPCNEYMISVICLYGELCAIFLTILIVLVDILLSILFRFSNYRVVYHTTSPFKRFSFDNSRKLLVVKEKDEYVIHFLKRLALHIYTSIWILLDKSVAFLKSTKKNKWRSALSPFEQVLADVSLFMFVVCAVLIPFELTNSSYVREGAFWSLAYLVASALDNTSVTCELNNIHTITFSRKTELSMELAFLFFPTMLVIYILTVSLSFLYNTEFNYDIQPLFSIFITGHQWYWTYEYHFFTLNFMEPESNNTTDWSSTVISFNSIIDLSTSVNRLLNVDRHLVLPVNTPIMIYVTSTDVIHSWALPQFGIKVDAVPGKLLSVPLTSFAVGTFYGQCSELCGVNHGFMPIVVEFVPFDTFLRYIYLQVFLSK